MGRGKRVGVLLVVACAALIAPSAASAVNPPNPIGFSPTGSLSTVREFPGAASLPGGKVLVAGGYDGTNTLQSTEIFNPVTGSFSPGPLMGKPRYSPAMATLADGRVLLAGGGVEPNVTTAEIFNPATGTFSATPGLMLEPRYDAGAARMPDGRVLIAGGFHSGSQLNTAEIFNPATGQFTSAGTMGAHRDGPAVAALADGRILIAGGYAGSNNYLRSAEVFTPSTGKFSPVGPLGVARYGPSGSTLPGDRALVAGGGDELNYLKTSEVFNGASNTFSAAGVGLLSTAREEAAAAPLADGRVLVAGGYNGDLNPAQLKSAEVLSVPANAFKAKLNGGRVIFKVKDHGIAQVRDVSVKAATTAKKKKPKLVKTSSKKGGPGKIKVIVKLTALGNARLAQKGKLRFRVTYTPDGGLAATKKLTLRG